MMMDATARKLAAEVLDLASDSFSNHGCNDFTIDDTLLNRSFVTAMNQWAGLGDVVPYVSNGKIYVQDWQVMSYCAHLLRND